MVSEFDELLRIQRQIANNLSREREMELKIEILTLLNSLTTGKKKKIQKEALIIEATNQGIGENEVEGTLALLKSDGLIKEKDGYIELL